MTQLTPTELLYAMPTPTRRRWQPLRAGIIGLFRYDDQVFTFHRGRLLLRGNNGTGKSMALEVLLPFVLDADLSPNRLSTFGGRERGMYLWLLGHDSNTERTNARGYVWVEFGRLTDDGPEYFTVGAGMETTRTSKRVHPWYFTTGARVGENFTLGKAGTEAVTRLSLDETLVTLHAQGFDGRVHPDPDTHRRVVNRVLFGLDDNQFTALRKSLLQLRKPKLSDKLSERGLAEVLRDSLPPVDTVITDELADGFERLDRHRTEIGELRNAFTALEQIHTSYAGYARKLAAQRAATLVDASGKVGQAGAKLGEARQSFTAARSALDRTQRNLRRRTETVRKLNTRIEAVQWSPEYREGKDLAPRREKAESLTLAASRARATATMLNGTASRVEHDAEQANRVAEQDRTEQQHRGELVERAALALADRAVVTTPADLVSQIARSEPSSERTATALVSLRQRISDAADLLDGLLRLLERSHKAATKVTEAQAATEAAEQVLAEAERALAEIEAKYRENLHAFLAEVDKWMANSGQLTAGAAAPQTWPELEPERAVANWAQHAAERRRDWLRYARREIGLMTTPVAEVEQRTHEVVAEVTALGGALDRTWRCATAVHDARIRFAEEVGTWAAGLDELCHDSPPPAELLSPDARRLESAQVVAWVTGAAARRHRTLGLQDSRLRTELSAVGKRLEVAEARHHHLATGGLSEPDPPPTRLSARDGRSGAPFYLLVDFVEADTDEVGRARQAMLEAALIGSGLADAWVCPDGTLLTEPGGRPLHDLQLIAGGPTAREPLSRGLRPDPAAQAEAGVPATIVAGLLEHIDLVDTAQTSAAPGLVVGWDGTWSAGVLRGGYQQDRAKLVGAASREAQRQIDLAALRELIAQLTEHRDALVGQLDDITAAYRRLEIEQQLPEDDEIQRADLGFVACRDEVETRARQLPDRARRLSALVPTVSRAAAVLANAECGDFADAAQTAVIVDDFIEIVRQVAEAAVTQADASERTVWDTTTGGHPPIALGAAQAAAGRIEAHGKALSTALTAAADTIDERERTVDRELSTRPDGDGLPSDRAELRQARIERNRANTALAEKQAQQQAGELVHREAELAADTALQAAGLTGQHNRINDYRHALTAYAPIAEDWVNAAARAAQAAKVAGAALADATEVIIQASDADAAAGEAELAAASAWEHYQGLHERMGLPYQEKVKELRQLQVRRAALESGVEQDRSRELELTGVVTNAENAVAAAEKEVGDAGVRRRDAAKAFVDLHLSGVFAAAGLADATPEETSSVWPGTVDDGVLAVITNWANAVAGRLQRDRVTVQQLERAMNAVDQKRHAVEPDLAGQVALRNHIRPVSASKAVTRS